MPKETLSATDLAENFSHILATGDLRPKGRNAFEITPTPKQLQSLASQIGVTELRKLRFKGEITALGKSDWMLTADIGATLVQPCVVSLDPVTTRIDQKITRQYIKGGVESIEGQDIEFDGQDQFETLESEIDLGLVMMEALTLLVPEYPRKAGVELENTAFTAPGVAPLQDEDVKPFAGLAALKDKMQK